MCDRQVDSDAAGPPHCPRMQQRDDAVTGVHEPLGLVPEFGPLFGERSQVAADSGVTPHRVASERREVRMPLDLRMALRDHGLHISPVASVVQPARRLHVCWRHLRAGGAWATHA